MTFLIRMRGRKSLVGDDAHIVPEISADGFCGAMRASPPTASESVLGYLGGIAAFYWDAFLILLSAFSPV